MENNCTCKACSPLTIENYRMIVCSICGCKRCPHANNHEYACTDSNDLNQPGSAYSDIPYPH